MSTSSHLAAPLHPCGVTTPAHQDPPTVVWWRDPPGDLEVPRTAGVAWARTDGALMGRTTIRSPHLRLQSADIEAKLGAQLAARLGERVVCGPAGTVIMILPGW